MAVPAMAPARGPRRWWSVAALAAALALGGAACSGSPDDAVATPPAVTASVASTTATTAVTAPTADPSSSIMSSVPAPPTSAGAGVTPVGFELVGGRVTAADGTTCDVCLWLAATPLARSQGLTGVTDLGAADGMVFRWDELTTGSFWMRDTPLPLSIAFFAADGSFVSATDMAPCLAPTPDADCTRYGALGPYQYAVEVPLGALAGLGVGPGSRLELLTGGCVAAASGVTQLAPSSP